MRHITPREIGIGFTTHRVFNTTKAAINFLIFLMLGEGLNSFVGMLTFTFIYTLMMIWFYDSTKIDLVLVEIRKKIMEEEKVKNKHLLKKILLSLKEFYIHKIVLRECICKIPFKFFTSLL